MKKLYTFCTCLFIITFFCEKGNAGQNPYAELGNIKNEFRPFKAFSILRLDLEIHSADSALKNIEYIHDLAKSKNDKNLISVYYETLAHYFSLHYDRVNNLATLNHDKALQNAQENDLPEQILRQTFSFGNYYFTYAKYADAYKYFKQSLLLIDQQGDANVAQVWEYYLTLARYFYEIKDYKLASEILNKVLVYNSRLSPRQLFDSMNSLGLIAVYTGKPQEAMSYFQKVVEKSSAVLDSAWMGIASGNIGYIYAQQNNIDKAIQYYSLDYEYNSKPSGDLISALGSLKKIAEQQFKKEDFEKALSNIEIYLTKMEKKPIRYKDLVEAYNLKYKLLDILNIEDGQLETLKDVNKYNQLLATLDNSTSTEKLKLEEEKANFEGYYYESKKYKKISILLVVTLVTAVVVLLGIMYKKGKEKAKPTQVVNEEEEEDNEYCPLSILSDKRFHSELNNKSVKISLELRHLLQGNLMINRNWEKFKVAYSSSFPSFFSNLMYKYPELTESDLRVLSLINLDLPNKDIADKLAISIDGIKKAKQRLKKKLSDHMVYH